MDLRVPRGTRAPTPPLQSFEVLSWIYVFARPSCGRVGVPWREKRGARCAGSAVFISSRDQRGQLPILTSQPGPLVLTTQQMSLLR